MKNNTLEKIAKLKQAAVNAYYAWMGGTMNDVREAMQELGTAIQEIQESQNNQP